MARGKQQADNRRNKWRSALAHCFVACCLSACTAGFEQIPDYPVDRGAEQKGLAQYFDARVLDIYNEPNVAVRCQLRFALRVSYGGDIASTSVQAKRVAQKAAEARLDVAKKAMNEVAMMPRNPARYDAEYLAKSRLALAEDEKRKADSLAEDLPASPCTMSKQDYRDEVILGRLRAYDLAFRDFEGRLAREGVGSAVATDWAVIGLDTAAAVTGTAAVKSVLAASAAALVGAKGKFDKEALFNRAMPGLLADMNARRKEVLVRIRSGMTQGVDQYPLHQALADLDDYGIAGSIPGAINNIVTTAGEAGKQADVRLERIRFETVDSSALVDRKEKLVEFARAFANAGSNSELNKLALAIEVIADPKNPRLTLARIQREVAITPESNMDALVNKVKKDFPSYKE